MTPALTDPAARRTWENYFAEVDRRLDRLGARQLRVDLEMHIVDSMEADLAGGGELARLQRALKRLGEPMDYLGPQLADEWISQGARTYSPSLILRGLVHAVRAGSRRTGIALAFLLGYGLIAIFTAIAALKPLWGDHVGLFRMADGGLIFGIVSDTRGAVELLGLWTIPIALVIAALLFAGLTTLLRRVTNRHAAAEVRLPHADSSMVR